MIPVELNRPEFFGRFFTAMGYADNPSLRIVARPAGDKILLYRVPEAEKEIPVHPLAVSLSQPEEKGNVLRIDTTGKITGYTLHHDGKLLFADVFPAADKASVLLAVNRIVVANKIGSVRIVCSGENCKAMQEALSRHFRNVELHPDGENRNRLFAAR